MNLWSIEVLTHLKNDVKMNDTHKNSDYLKIEDNLKKEKQYPAADNLNPIR